MIFDNQAKETGKKEAVGLNLPAIPEWIAGRVNFMVKLLRAYGGCLGEGRRGRTW
jgi:hypothetical protein